MEENKGITDTKAIQQKKINPKKGQKRLTTRRKHKFSPFLFEMIAEGYTEVVEDLITNNPIDINAPNDYGITPIVHAIQESNIDIIKLLLDKGADVHMEDNQGQTPLFAIIFAQENRTKVVEIIRLLLDNGAQINPKDNKRQTPLMLACANKKLKIAQVLIEFILSNNPDEPKPSYINAEFTPALSLFWARTKMALNENNSHVDPNASSALTSSELNDYAVADENAPLLQETSFFPEKNNSGTHSFFGRIVSTFRFIFSVQNGKPVPSISSLAPQESIQPAYSTSAQKRLYPKTSGTVSTRGIHQQNINCSYSPSESFFHLYTDSVASGSNERKNLSQK